MHRARLLGARRATTSRWPCSTTAPREWLAWEGSGDYLDQEHGGAHRRRGHAAAARARPSSRSPTRSPSSSGYTPASVLPDLPVAFPDRGDGRPLQPAELRRRRSAARCARGRPWPGPRTCPRSGSLSRTGVPDLLRVLRRVGLTTLEKTPRLLRLRAHHGRRRGAPRRAGGRLRRASRAAGSWRRADAVRRIVRDGDAARLPRAAVRRARRLRRAPPSGWPTSSPTPTRAPTSSARGGSLDFPFPVAVKTGTSQAYHDNWTIGFTRDVTVGVWVGNFDRTPLRNSSGRDGRRPDLPRRDAGGAGRLGGRCAGGGPSPLVDRPSDLAPRGRSARSPGARRRRSARASRRSGSPPIVPPRPAAGIAGRAAAWSSTGRPPIGPGRAQQGLLASTAPDARGRRTPRPSRRRPRPRARATRERLRIVNPPPGATYLFDPTLRAEFQTLPLRAVADGRRARLTWEVDGRPVGSVARGPRARLAAGARRAHGRGE